MFTKPNEIINCGLGKKFDRRKMSTEIKCFTCNYRSIRMNICYTDVVSIPPLHSFDDFGFTVYFLLLHVLPHFWPPKNSIHTHKNQAYIICITVRSIPITIVCFTWLSVSIKSTKFFITIAFIY